MVVYGYARLVGYNARPRAGAGHPRERGGRGQPASSPCTCARGTNGRTGIPSPPRTSATGGRTSPTTTSSRRSARPRSCWSTASCPPSRSSTRPRCATPGRAEPVLPARAGRARAAVHLRPGALPEAVPRRTTPTAPRSKREVEGGRRAQLGERAAQPLDNHVQEQQPDLPTLQPWVNTDAPPPSERFVFERNPYFHRVDDGAGPAAALHRPRGHEHRRRQADPGQDRRRRQRPAGPLPALRRLHLPEGRARSATATQVRLWKTAAGSHMALFPNLNVKDPVWRELLRDVRFRRALSLAIDRRRDQPGHLLRPGVEGNNTVLRRSPLFDDELPDALGGVRSRRRPTRCSTRSA